MAARSKSEAFANEAVIVTRKDLLAIKEAEDRLAKASREFTEAEKAVKPLRLALAEKVLGVKDWEEFKELSPEVLGKRVILGNFEVVRGAPKFEFVKTSEGRYPAWKRLFIAAQGEVEAEKAIARTTPIFSYRVEVKA